MPLFARGKEHTKRSVDLSTKSDVALDAFRVIAEKQGVSLSRGAAIDAVVAAVLGLKPSQAYQLLSKSKQQLRSAQDLLDATSRKDALAWRDAEEAVDAWEQACELFGVLADGYEEPTPMRTIQMREARLLIPDLKDWILVNEESARTSSVATIVEVKNGAQFSMPHFVYFEDGEATPRMIDRAILTVYPRYKEVLNAKVEPIKDANGRYLNIEELKTAPWPGYFPARPVDSGSKNPYGVALIPDQKDGSN